MTGKNQVRSFDRSVLSLVAVLIVVGLVAVSSASAVLSFERYGHSNYYLYRQLLFAVLGLVLVAVFSRIDYRVWRRWSRPLLLLGFLLLILVLVPGIGYQPTTARSWFRIGSFLFQPSEFVKLAVIFYLAAWFERKKAAEQNFWFGLLPPLLVVGLVFGLVAWQPDLGTATIFAAITAIALFAAGVKWRHLLVLLAAGLASLWLLIKTSPYRASRIVTFLDPSLDPQGIGYHIRQALLAIGSGGLWGYGFGASRQKHNFLPEPIGDSIFAVMAEEFGFLRISLVIVLFALLFAAGLRIAKKAPDKFGSLAAVGITGWIASQALVNIGSISGLLPLTGVTLPFISYGGSSLLALSVAVGILLNISRHRL